MPELEQITYTHHELTKVLLRDQGITSGHWGVYLKFRFEGGNFALAEDMMRPGAVTLIESIGIQRLPENSPLAVDASTLAAEPQRKPRRRRVREKQGP
jgi:hypothetical protein